MGYGRGRFEGAVGLNVMLVEGVVAGIWERKVSGKRLSIKVDPFADLTPGQHEQIHEEAVRIGHFLEREPVISVGPLS